MREIGAAAMPIIPSFDGLKGKLENGLGRPLGDAGDKAGRDFGDKAGKSMTSSLGKAAKRASIAIGAALAVGAVGAFKYGMDAVDLAADLEQSIGAVDTVFKDSADQMHAWGKAAAMDVGLTRNEFNELGTLIGSQLKNGGTAMDRLAPKTNKLIKLGADLSSMYGGDTREAVEALSSALKGERDPIERYGVSLNQAKIDAEAAALGFEKVDGALSSQAQQAATLSLIVKQTKDAHGNFAREADTLSGKQQRLKASLEDTKTEIGTALLPIMADAADFLLEEGVPAFQKFADWFTDKGAPALRGFADDMKPVADEVLPAVASAVESIGGFLKDAAPYAKDVVGAFNDMPDWAKELLVGGGAALAIGSKLKGGKVAAGTAGKLLGARGSTPANPLFVSVVGGGLPAGDPRNPRKSNGGGWGSPAALVTGAASLLLFKENMSNTSALFGDIDATEGFDKLRSGLDREFGRYADDLGIDLDTFAQELYRVGSESDYVQESLRKIEDAAEPGFWADLADNINPFSNKINNIRGGLKDLREGLDVIDAEAKRRQRVESLLSGDPNDQTYDVGAAFAKIPDAKVKLLFDPESERTRKGVRDILGDVDGLTRKDFRLIFSALTLSKARDDASALKTLMEDLTGQKASTGVGGGWRESVFNPFRDGARAKAGGGGIYVDKVNVQGTSTSQLMDDLTNRGRRAAIGGY